MNESCSECAVPVAEHLLTREEQPELSSHALRNPLEDQLLRLLSAVHAHSLSVLCKVVLPPLLLQELLRLSKEGKQFHEMQQLKSNYNNLLFCQNPALITQHQIKIHFLHAPESMTNIILYNSGLN